MLPTACARRRRSATTWVGAPRSKVTVASAAPCMSSIRVRRCCEVDRLVEDRRRAGVDPRDLQQLEHHLLEQLHLLGEHRERFDDLRWQLVSAPVDDLDRGGDRGQRRAELVAHVGREACFAFDPFLQRTRHRVERLRQAAEVGVVELAEAGVECTAGDALGSFGDGGERPEHTAGRGPTDRGGDERRATRRRPPASGQARRACDRARSARTARSRSCRTAAPELRPRAVPSRRYRDSAGDRRDRTRRPEPGRAGATSGSAATDVANHSPR